MCEADTLPGWCGCAHAHGGYIADLIERVAIFLQITAPKIARILTHFVTKKKALIFQLLSFSEASQVKFTMQPKDKYYYRNHEKGILSSEESEKWQQLQSCNNDSFKL